MLNNSINWGIIGCGDVAEVKSGPAFQKVKNSSLVSVMRRDENKIKDFAMRHGVAHWTTEASALIENNLVNAVYIATPPSSHLEYALQAIKVDSNGNVIVDKASLDALKNTVGYGGLDF